MEEELFIEKTSIVNGVSRKRAPLFTKLPRRVLLGNPRPRMKGQAQVTKGKLLKQNAVGAKAQAI